jgi:hypothetical protein
MFRLDLEFLPVYRPSPAECADPQLYANNIQKVTFTPKGGEEFGRG